MRLSILFFFWITGTLTAQSFLEVDTTEYIEWQEERPLGWSDYQFKRMASKEAYALTTVFHSIRGGMKKGKPNFQVRVLYVKKESWTTNNTSSALLNHEKLHFDLAELYGRKMRRQIEILGRRGEKSMKVYKANIEELLNAFNRRSLDYDKETDHGKLAEPQLEWHDYISSELHRLKKYKYINK